MAQGAILAFPVDDVVAFAITIRTRFFLIYIFRFKPPTARAMTTLTPLRKQVLLNMLHCNIPGSFGIAAVVDFRTAGN